MSGRPGPGAAVGSEGFRLLRPPSIRTGHSGKPLPGRPLGTPEGCGSRRASLGVISAPAGCPAALSGAAPGWGRCTDGRAHPSVCSSFSLPCWTPRGPGKEGGCAGTRAGIVETRYSPSCPRNPSRWGRGRARRQRGQRVQLSAISARGVCPAPRAARGLSGPRPRRPRSGSRASPLRPVGRDRRRGCGGGRTEMPGKDV